MAYAGVKLSSHFVLEMEQLQTAFSRIQRCDVKNLPNMFQWSFWYQIKVLRWDSSKNGRKETQHGQNLAMEMLFYSKKVTEQQVLTIAWYVEWIWFTIFCSFLSPLFPKIGVVDDATTVLKGSSNAFFWICDGEFAESTLPHSAFVLECDIPRFVPLTRSFLCLRPNRSFPIPKSSKSYSWRTKVGLKIWKHPKHPWVSEDCGKQSYDSWKTKWLVQDIRPGLAGQQNTMPTAKLHNKKLGGTRD